VNTISTAVGNHIGGRSANAITASVLTVAAITAGAAMLATSPTAAADPVEHHTVVYTITGGGSAFSIVTDPGPSVYPDGNNYPALPWSTTVQVDGNPLVQVSFTGRDGTHDCSISVDGKAVPVDKPSPGQCTYQIPAGAPAGQNLPYGPDTCKQGYVWRGANSSDHVCVTPQTRTETAQENAQAAALKDPNGGAYGPDTCRQGFVWRDAFPGDKVCVIPASRDRAAADNAAASSTRVLG
jgi:hypothetical protein